MYLQVVHLHLQLYSIELTSEASADFTSKPELSVLIRMRDFIYFHQDNSGEKERQNQGRGGGSNSWRSRKGYQGCKSDRIFCGSVIAIRQRENRTDT
jgi:hypothetical protein